MVASVYQDGAVEVFVYFHMTSPQKARSTVLFTAHALRYQGGGLDTDKEFLLTVIKRNPLAIQYASEHVKRDKAFLLQAVQQNGLVLEFATPHLRADRDIVLAAVRQNPRALRHADSNLRSDFEIVVAASEKDGRALDFIQSDMQNNSEINAESDVFDHHGKAQRAAHRKSPTDADVIRKAVSDNGLALQHACFASRNDRSIVMIAVRQNGLALEFASANLKQDKKVVNAALHQNGLALAYAAPNVRCDPVLVEAAIRRKGSALKYASKELRSTRSIVLLAVKRDGLALEYADDHLQDDRAIVEVAINQNDAAIAHASLNLQYVFRHTKSVLEAHRNNERKRPSSAPASLRRRIQQAKDWAVTRVTSAASSPGALSSDSPSAPARDMQTGATSDASLDSMGNEEQNPFLPESERAICSASHSVSAGDRINKHLDGVNGWKEGQRTSTRPHSANSSSTKLARHLDDQGSSVEASQLHFAELPRRVVSAQRTIGTPAQLRTAMADGNVGEARKRPSSAGMLQRVDFVGSDRAVRPASAPQQRVCTVNHAKGTGSVRPASAPQRRAFTVVNAIGAIPDTIVPTQAALNIVADSNSQSMLAMPGTRSSSANQGFPTSLAPAWGYNTVFQLGDNENRPSGRCESRCVP